MSSVTFLVDHEWGHINPTLHLAKTLRRRGHRVSYVGLADAEESIRRQGFEFATICRDILPQGFGIHGARPIDDEEDLCFFTMVKDTTLDDVFARLAPDVALVNSMHLLEALMVRHRHRIPTVLFTPTLGPLTRKERCATVIPRVMNLSDGAHELIQIIKAAGHPIRRLDDLTALVATMPELMLIPPEFDLPGEAGQPNVYHVGPSVDLDRHDAPMCWDDIEPGPLAYSSLGSQSHLEPALRRRFVRTVIQAFERMLGWQVIVSVGLGCELGEFRTTSPRIHLRTRVPQIAALSRAAVAITHGGIGTMKECVLAGVPMVLYPLMRDQWESSRRAVALGLGRAAEIATMSATEVEALVTEVSSNAEIRESVARMRERFLACAEPTVGVDVIERVAASSGRAVAVR
jgi:MGT family glycosyltransferase